MNWLQHLKHWLEYFGGSALTPPAAFPKRIGWLLLLIWWLLLIPLIIIFSGQSSKFIYIDF